jgi:protein transport protein SEC24
MVYAHFYLTAVDRSVSSSLSDAREAMLNAAMDSVASFGGTIPPAQRIGSLPMSYTLRMLPAFILALLKSVSHLCENV